MKLFQFFQQIGKATLMLLLLLATNGCTKEDLSNCDLFLQFRYDYNMASVDLFREQVEEVKVFVFGKDGKYQATLSQKGDTLKASGYRMNVPYYMAGSTFVVWAGRTDQFYLLPTLSIGDPIEKLTLEYKPNDQQSNQLIDNLWHSGPMVMTFTEDYGTLQTVSLLRNTNDFKIQILDKNGNSLLNNHTVRIVADNGSYDHTNNYLPSRLNITYHPHTIAPQMVNLRTLRVLEREKMKLTVVDANDNPIEIGGATEINLIEYLKQSAPSGMSTQEYFDRCYEWDITLQKGQSSIVMISINNWVCWFQESDM